MSLHLAAGEPAAGPWRAERLTVVASALGRRTGESGTRRRPVVLAVDGRSSSGKTTLAARLQSVVAGAVVVHTDDIAWWHSRFGWADLLIDGILRPVQAGRPVSYRPPQWVQRQRPGAIEVSADCPLLIIEGVGAARRESAELTDAAIWVQADGHETEGRNLARVGQPGGPATIQSLRDWMAEEVPFLASQRPWERASPAASGRHPATRGVLTDSSLVSTRSRQAPGETRPAECLPEAKDLCRERPGRLCTSHLAPGKGGHHDPQGC